MLKNELPTMAIAAILNIKSEIPKQSSLIDRLIINVLYRPTETHLNVQEEARSRIVIGVNKHAYPGRSLCPLDYLDWKNRIFLYNFTKSDESRKYQNNYEIHSPHALKLLKQYKWLRNYVFDKSDNAETGFEYITRLNLACKLQVFIYDENKVRFGYY